MSFDSVPSASSPSTSGPSRSRPVTWPPRPSGDRPVPCGRWAPTPSGWLHLGNARTALVAWLSIRHRQGRFLWRLEDLDQPRTVEGAAEAAMEDLAWLGLDWDEGPEGAGVAAGGPDGPYVQSARGDLYEAALAHLHGRGRLFPCRHSRKDLMELASAPHGDGGLPPYPASLRPRELPDDWFERWVADPGDAAVRFLVHDREVRFEDRVFGTVEERVDELVGDFVLKRRDGVWAYQLAVVVDDVAMGVDEVVRGRDLLDSTARQVQLFEALDAEPPAWAHVPLVVDGEGEKLSKRHESLTLRSLREAGVRPERLVGWMAFSLGLRESAAPVAATELVEGFSWERVRSAGTADTVLPEEFVARMVGAG